MNKIQKSAVVLSLLALPFAQGAYAVVDLTPITSAQTDMLAYAGAMLALGIAVWGLMKVVGMFRGK